VRQSGVFSAVIQPPLILFFAVPTAYFVFHGSKITGIKDTLINCGYPLIERFPLMFFTSAVVLLIGMGRWYLGMSARRAAPVDAAAPTPDAAAAVADSLLAAAGTSALDGTEKASARRGRRHSIERPGRGETAGVEEQQQRPARKPRTAATGSAKAPRSRHARPPETEIIEPVADRPRRPRSGGPPVEPPAEPRRRPRPQAREPRESREPRASTPAARTKGPSGTTARSGTNGPIGTSAVTVPSGGPERRTTTPTSLAPRTARTEATGPMGPGRTTRCHGSGTAAPTTARRAPRTATSPGAPATRTPIPGSTTSSA
jgi:hypothetical protein